MLNDPLLPSEELSMTKKGTALGEVVLLPSLVWCVEEARKAGKENVMELSVLRDAE